MKSLTRQRLVIVGLFAAFMLPIVIALLLNLPGVRWTPFGLRNHGDLLQPPPSLEAVAARAVDGGDLGDTAFADTWTILVLAPSPCDALCESAIDKAQRARLALGEHGGRTRLLWLATAETPPVAEIQRLKTRYPALRVAAPVQQGEPDALPAPLRGRGVFVVDPRAFLILRYPPDLEGRGLLKDLERLLRYAEEDA